MKHFERTAARAALALAAAAGLTGCETMQGAMQQADQVMAQAAKADQAAAAQAGGSAAGSTGAAACRSANDAPT